MLSVTRTHRREIKSKMIGRKAIEAAAIFVQELALAEHGWTPERVLLEREVILDELFPSAKVRRDATHSILQNRY